MKFAYYPGCSGKGTSVEYEISTKAVCSALGIYLQELADWSCCGSTPAHATDTLLSAAFMLLSYRYLISEKRDSLERNAGYIAGFTAVYYQEFRDIQDELYSSYVANIALISDSFVIVADRDGNIQYATDGSNIYTYRNAAPLPCRV